MMSWASSDCRAFWTVDAGPRPCSRRTDSEYSASAPRSASAQDRPLARRELLPEAFVILGLAGYQPSRHPANILHIERSCAAQLGMVPQFVSQALNVVGNQIGGREQQLNGVLGDLPAPARELRQDEFPPRFGRNLPEEQS